MSVLFGLCLNCGGHSHFQVVTRQGEVAVLAVEENSFKGRKGGGNGGNLNLGNGLGQFIFFTYELHNFTSVIILGHKGKFFGFVP